MKLTNLDVLALAGLPDSALVPKLANKKLGGPFRMEDARILVRALKPDHGTLEKLATAIYEEVQRQRKVHDARKAQATLRRVAGKTLDAQSKYSKATPAGCVRRDLAKQRLARSLFGDYIENSFDDEMVAFLEIMTGADTYSVKFLDVGARPVVACVVQVQSNGKDRPCHNLLLYKVKGGKVKGVPTAADNVKDAWADQVPPDALEVAELGYKFETDFERQLMVARHPDGDTIEIPWKNRLDDA